MKTLYILRGVSGSGKSTLAKQLALDDCIFEADKYFYDDYGDYIFDPKKLGNAHFLCKSYVEHAMKYEIGEIQRIFGEIKDYSKLVVSNTSTTEKEIQPYIDLANKYGYQVVSLIIEKRHEGVNQHNVPLETLQKQEKNLRNSIKLS